MTALIDQEPIQDEKRKHVLVTKIKNASNAVVQNSILFVKQICGSISRTSTRHHNQLC